MTQIPEAPSPELTSDLEAGVPNAAPLAVGQLFAVNGVYPVHETGGPATATLAMVRSFAAANWAAFGAPSCAGQRMTVIANPALFSVLGPTYGGDGQQSFMLPDLRSRVPVGNSPEGAMTRQTLPMTYLIAVDAAVGDAYPMVGAVGLFGGNFAPPGWMIADGSLLPISEYVPLFEAIGNAFGGDGRSSFALPDLSGAAVVGAGQTGSGAVGVGQAIPATSNGGIGGLGFNYIVSIAGELPPNEGNGAFPASASLLAEIIAFGGSAITGGWAAADGQLLAIADYQALFQLIGTTYGGDGEQSFALPNLQGRMIAGHD